MKSWRYKRAGAVEGPVSGEDLRALYDAGEITLDTSVRSTAPGGEWRRYGDTAELKPPSALAWMPWPARRLWPLFLIGVPVVGGLIDVFICQSQGNALVESAAPWIIHFPVALMLAATVVWLTMILAQSPRRGRESRGSGILIWILAVPFYMSWLWWSTPSVSSLVNLVAGLDFPGCPSDIAQGEVKDQFPGAAAKAGRAGLAAESIIDTNQQLSTDRIRICTAKVIASDGQAHPVRFKIEDRGNTLFHNTLRGLHVTMILE